MDELTLIMTTNADWNNDGFAPGSRTVEEDWKDWKRWVMSRDKAKLLRKRTWNGETQKKVIHTLQYYAPTRFDMATLKSTNNVSSCADLSILCTPTNQH